MTNNPNRLTTTTTSDDIEALRTELRQLCHRLGQCVTQSTQEPEAQSLQRALYGSTRSRITLRGTGSIITTLNRSSSSLSLVTGETSEVSSDGVGYAASVHSNRSAQSQLSSRSSQYTYEAMSIIDMYMDSIYAISPLSVDSHISSGNATFLDVAPSALPMPILLPRTSSERGRGRIYSRLVRQGISSYLRELQITDPGVMVLMRTYRNKQGRGFMETIADYEDLKVCAALLLLLADVGSTIPLEHLRMESFTPAQLKEILIPKVHSSLEPIMGKTCTDALLLGLRALDVLLKAPSMISAAVSK